MQAPQVVDEFLRGTRWSVFTVSANARSASEVNGVTRECKCSGSDVSEVDVVGSQQVHDGRILKIHESGVDRGGDGVA